MRCIFAALNLKEMYATIHKLFFVVILMISISTQANDFGKKDPIVTKTIKEETKKASVKGEETSVQNVFMKVKRVENLLKPKKKLRKRKYTIA